MSEHVWAQENIAAYVAGGLDPAEGERLEAHLGECTACERAVEEARSLDRRLAPLFASANPGPALEDRVIQALPTHGFVRRAPLSGKQKAMLAAAAVVLLAASGAGISMLMERGSLSTPTLAFRCGALQALPLYEDAHEPPKDVSAPAERADVSAKTSGKAAESPPSADDLAKEVRDTTFSVLQDGEPSTKRSYNKIGLAYHPEFLSSSARQDKEVSELWQDLNKGSKSTATLSDPASAFTPSGQPPGPPIVGGGAGYGGIGARTTGAPPNLNMPGQSLAEGGDRPKELVWKYSSGGNLPPLAQFFFKPGDDREDKAGAKVADLDDSKGDSKSTKSLTLVPPSSPVATSAKTEAAVGLKTDQAPPPEPQPAPRKIIIRTGDLEFEIDSFDASVAVIMKLVTAAKGAFVGTINSDKLPNGKVRGSIVVRVPPDLLDTFVLDLRKELAKSGELKNQHIGSLDITKQFTDLESRLRAARTMEERLLAIIKDGKGQIKDLLMAEKELGVWRTQIESLEGELRYYSNQASLSTLTIKLYEKDIRTAASVTESERVQAGLEVDDVEKAHREALKAILEAKGRVTRSELKQHAAGQFNAVLHFEVAVDAAGPLRDRLKQLGTMVRLQVDRVQQTEGGGTAPKDGKIERGPTQFLLSLYNLANIAPRETIILRIAAADVPAVYQKLREVVAKAKGHVINAQLDEKDRQNINAQLDFHVSRLSEGEILAALPSAGETLSRQVNRIPESDNVTDSKVLFRIALLDADSIQPRETVTVKIAAADVPAAYQKLREAIAKTKARVLTAQLNEQDRRNVTAQLDFTLRRTDEAALQGVLGGAGETLSRQANRLPENATLTDSKLLFQVTLLDVESIQPRETVTVKIAATDVPAAYQRLREIVAQVKGRILSARSMSRTAVISPRNSTSRCGAAMRKRSKLLWPVPEKPCLAWSPALRRTARSPTQRCSPEWS